MPEWLKGTGCKPVGFGLRRFESYPFHQPDSPFAGTRVRVPPVGFGGVEPGGCSSMVELQPSKLATRVRFPSPAPDFRARRHIRAAVRRQEREHGLAGARAGFRLDQRIDRETTDLVTGLKKNGEGEV